VCETVELGQPGTGRGGQRGVADRRAVEPQAAQLGRGEQRGGAGVVDRVAGEVDLLEIAARGDRLDGGGGDLGVGDAELAQRRQPGERERERIVEPGSRDASSIRCAAPASQPSSASVKRCGVLDTSNRTRPGASAARVAISPRTRV